MQILKLPTILFILFLTGYLAFVGSVFASSTDGTIDSTYKYAWGENIGWLNFGTSNGNVHITDSGLSGYALSENAGWINLGAVVNDGAGNLSGYAWGENIGYVKFNPTNGGVIINSSGEFTGSALGENIGWIIFGGDYKVKTDWRPSSTRSVSRGSVNGGRYRAPFMFPTTPVISSPNLLSNRPYNFGTTILKNGSKGEAVKELQKFLNAKLNLGLVIDGKLGPKTIAVIKKWQKDNGLIADGLIGTKTKARMNASVQ